MRTVTYEKQQKTGVITLNRPDVKNAINKEMHEDLYNCLSRANEDPEVRVVILTGSGDAFSSGADLKSIPLEELETFDHGDYLEETYNRLIFLLERMEKPTVAYLNGMAVGAGLSIALACDFRYAAPDAVCSLSFLNIGLAPDAGASYYLPRLVGLSKALELGTGKKVLPAEAEEIGLIHGTGWPEELLKRLVVAPLPAYGLMKQNMKHGFDASLPDILDMEVRSQRIAGRSRAHQEALQAFVQRNRQ
ncbi:enoyl-CoA hydratase/isomerase family protein [Alkalicoccus chagannorensis]|uniref:enoyl-CoA hydratase/isomerase family protein n=1 Tax=Alkalicoccus chagannorensis TaxID=427072 RepID=UPI0003FF2768|nr:enoyl-CoA hydratase/isomerase family protein [Alkalicoccus chagannorensis]